MEKTFDTNMKQLLSVYFAVKVTEKIVRSRMIILRTPDLSLKILFKRIHSGELYDKYCPFFKTLKSKPIEVDVITEHSQLNLFRKPINGIVRTSAERCFETGFVNNIKNCSTGLSRCYPKNGYTIQQKFYRKC